ncbi:hypothetical protein [Tenacibaculum finnmarkense]|uniref:hypothetical protein n=1 Tax=Tenacibaculum finnmarkense TaxID=2781243 RepID=UPI001EFB30EE|nr:hypothetical protein [Tenacibaculum finnmarkense]MCG8796649.1 hypothetical protein [Tenacibaculum finnmarkense]MCG8798985.1 hypothetical protein [Tenacibaculum finnmarkense]
MNKTRILYLISFLIFAISIIILFNNYITYLELRDIKSDNETNAVIDLLDENFHNYYSLPENDNNWVQIGELPENHDVDVSEEILEYLNTNRNLWQYEYIKNPIKTTDQTSYTLGHFELAENKTNTILYSLNHFYSNWKYFKETQNHNLLLETLTQELDNTIKPDSEKFWFISLNTLFDHTLDNEKLNNNDTIYYNLNEALYYYNSSVKYPDYKLDVNIDSDMDAIEAAKTLKKLSKLDYYQKYVKRTDRDVETFQNIWENGKQYFFSFMSQKRYNGLCKPFIDQLFTTYNTVTQTNTYKKHFEKYDLDDSEFYALPNTEEFKDGYQWAYSFWDRRFTEGTMEYVHQVLLEIKNHYE